MADRIIKLGPFHRIYVDDSSNLAYLQFYNQSTGTWETVIEFDTANKNILTDLPIKKDTPTVKLIGTETGGKELDIRENAGVIEIYDAAAGEVEMTLEKHGDRHNRGGVDPLDYSLIMELIDSGAVSCTVGTGGTPSSTAVYSLPSNWTNIVPLAVYIDVGGTVASGETISVSVKAVLDDGNSYEIASYSITGGTGTKTETSPFSVLLSSLISAATVEDGKKITSIVADVSSSATSTSATVSVRVVGVRT